MPHFQLVTIDGVVLGVREVSRPGWLPRSVIYRGPDEPNLQVVREFDAEKHEPGEASVSDSLLAGLYLAPCRRTVRLISNPPV